MESLFFLYLLFTRPAILISSIVQVKMRYRGKGVGRALLEEAVELVAKKGGDGIEFADDHANSARILKPLFNKKQDRDELRAYDSLQKVVEEKGVFHRSRRQRTP